jgi:hypothetical protein
MVHISKSQRLSNPAWNNHKTNSASIIIKTPMIENWEIQHQ